MAIGSGTVLGFNSRLAFGNETTWGTIATATHFMEFRSCSLRKNIVNEKIESLGTGRAIGRRVQKEVTVEGTIAHDLHPVDAIFLLKHAMMGSVTSLLAGTSDSWNHTFSVGDLSDITQQGITFEVQPDANTTTAWIFHGCRVNSYKISAEIGQPVHCEVNVIGKDATLGTFATTTVAYSSVRPFLFQDGTFSYGDTLGNLTTENIIAFEMTIENNLQNDEKARSIGDTALTNLPPGRRNVMLSITQRFDTTTAWERFIQNTQGAVRLFLDTGQTIGSIDSPSTSYSMHIDFPQVFYNSAQPEIPDSGILVQEIEIDTIADTITGSGVELIVSLTDQLSSHETV